MIYKLSVAVLLIFSLAGCTDKLDTETDSAHANPAGSWDILAIGETLLHPEDFEGELPSMVLSPEEGTVSGYDGCNRFNGGISVEEGQINFSELASTRRYCQHMDTIDLITAAFAGATVEYEVIGDELLLKSKGQTLLSLARQN